jgi:tRNA-specific 2-thiouridylase
VVRIDIDTNRVILGKLSELQTDCMVVSNLNFISSDELRSPMNVTVKIRYRSPCVPAVIVPLAVGMVRVAFEKPVRGVCPGQAAVFYDGDTVVGGGVIEAAPAI